MENPKGNASFRFILDTSALLAYLANEPASDQVARNQPESAIPFMAYSELYYLVWQRQGRTEADRIYALVRAWNLPTLIPEERVWLAAGRFKAAYRLGIADSFIAAFSLVSGATLMTLDPDFLPLRKEISVLKLP